MKRFYKAIFFSPLKLAVKSESLKVDISGRYADIFPMVKAQKVIFALIACMLLTPLFSHTVQAGDLVQHAVSDIQTMYLFESEDEIDWPVIYYLNEQFGSRVDLVRLKERSSFLMDSKQVTDNEIYLHTLHLSETDSLTVASALVKLFAERLPDIVLIDEQSNKPSYNQIRKQLLNMQPSTERLFNILKVFRRLSENEKTDNKYAVVLNSKELYNRYKNRIALEVPQLFEDYTINTNQFSHLTKYSLEKKYLKSSGYENDFLSGVSNFRLLTIIDSLLVDGPMKRTIASQAKKFSSFFKAAQVSTGKRKVDLVVDGYRELLYLNQHDRAMEQYPEYKQYTYTLIKKAEKAALDLVGINWEGKIILRDSPHGPKLKFRAAVSVDGPKEVTINNFLFHPYWDTTDVKLTESAITIQPHQSYVQEYLLDIDRAYLETAHPDSIKFSVEITYGQIPLYFNSVLPIWEAPDLKIRLEPNFFFVKPFPKVDVDRLVSNLNLKVIITKPYNYSGTAEINFATPRGMFAGAYRKDIILDKGSITETIRIPFTISNLFELGTQLQTVELLVGNKVVAADTGKIRIASCQIPDTRTVGFLPDKNGLLEDILAMTDAAYRPLTDRTLVKGDLEAYDVIVIGSDAYKNYPSFTKIKDRFEQYVREGGTIVILPQSEDWPSSAIPLSFVPTVEVVDKNDLTNRIISARVLSKPYPISDKNLLSRFYKKTEVQSAVIAPAERVFVTPSGATLLSVSRIGDGEIIFCGFPLLEMISDLDIEAIHLFANILNY